MRSTPLIPIGFIILISSCALVGREAETSNGSLTKSAILHQLSEPWESVHQYLIEYEATATDSKGEFLSGVRKQVAASDMERFYHSAFHFTKTIPWNEDPFAQEFYVSEGHQCHGWPFKRSYSDGTIHPGDFLGGSTWQDLIWSVVPRWPLKNYSVNPNPETGQPVVLAEMLKSEGYELLASGEMIHGEQCHVFDFQGIDRIWIAAGKGLCLMQRETRDRLTRELVSRTEVDRIGEIGKGLWLPMEFRVQSFGNLSGGRRGLVRESKMRILRVLLNQAVPENTFIPQYPPGSTRYTDESGSMQMVPGGYDLLDQNVSFLQQRAGLPTSPRGGGRRILWLLGGALFGGFLVSFPSRAVLKRH